jgi:hypothetical protein
MASVSGLDAGSTEAGGVTSWTPMPGETSAGDCAGDGAIATAAGGCALR